MSRRLIASMTRMARESPTALTSLTTAMRARMKRIPVPYAMLMILKIR